MRDQEIDLEDTEQDIVCELRKIYWIAPNAAELKAEIVCKKAADEIESLREEIERLRERNSELTWAIQPDRMGQ